MTDLRLVLKDDVAATTTHQAIQWLAQYAASRDDLIPAMAGRAEELVGDPEDVAQRTWALVQDVLDQL